MVQQLFDDEMCVDRNLHGYHCGCDSRDDWMIHATSDCTASGGEYIIGGSRGILFGSDKYVEIIQRFSDHAIDAGCSVTGNVGMHTHVDLRGLTVNAQRLLLRNYLVVQRDFQRLVKGPLQACRSNGCTAPTLEPSHYMRTEEHWTCDPMDLDFGLPGRPTLNFHGNGRRTVEFRVPNSTKAAWRIYLVGAICSALVESAADGHSFPRETPILEALEAYLTPDVVVLAERQMNA